MNQNVIADEQSGQLCRETYYFVKTGRLQS
jgi:hypothetical protein